MSSLITDIGNQKLLVASPQTPVTIKSVAVGSGRGAFDGSIQSLQDQKWIGNASAPIKNGKTLEFDCQIPLGIGGFEVAEWGLIDIEGDLIAYGQIPETVNKIISMTLTPTFVMELGDSISAEIVVTDEINFRHNGMTERDSLDAHPTKSITGLDTALKTLTDKDAAIDAELLLNKKITVVKSNYTLTDSDTGTILVDATSGNITITMAKASSAKALRYNLLRTDISANTVTLQPATGDNFVGEGFKWPLAYMRTSEPFIFFKYSETGWMGVRGNRAQIGETDNIPSFSVNGTHIGRLLLESNVKNVLNSTDTLNPLSANMGKTLNDQSFGVGQSWQDVTSIRVLGTTYTNTTSKTIGVFVNFTDISSDSVLTIGGQSFGVIDTGNTGRQTIYFTVPAGVTYSISQTGVIAAWKEQR